MLVEWVVFGSAFFWILGGGWILLLLLFSYHEKWGGAIFAFCLMGAILTFLSNINPFMWLFAHWYVAPAYLIAGVVWSLIRWLLLLKDVDEAYFALREQYETSKTNQTALPDITWLEYLSDRWATSTDIRPSMTRISWSQIEKVSDIIPKPDDYKGEIANWIINWPFSLVNQLFGNLLRRLGEFLFNRIRYLYELITKLATSRIVADEVSTSDDLGHHR
jgi:hypothetical protein